MGRVHERRFSASSSESLHLLVAAEARVPDIGASRGFCVPLVRRLPSGNLPTPARVPDNVPCFAFFLVFGLLGDLRRTEQLFWEESSSDLSDQIRKKGRES